MKNELVVSQSQVVKSFSPVTSKVIESMLPVKQKYLMAALMPKVKDLEPLDVVNDLITIITTTYTIAGQKPDESTLAIFADEFYTRVKEKYPAITIEEIRHALRAGVYGEYGEFFGLNPKTFFGFVNSYMHGLDRITAIKEFEAKRLSAYHSQQVETTFEEREQAAKDFVNFLFNDFLENRLVTDYIPVYIYDFLESKKIIQLSVEEKQAVFNRAAKYHRSMNGSGKLSSKLKEVLNCFVVSAEEKTIIKIIAKQLSVNDFFEKSKAGNRSKIF